MPEKELLVGDTTRRSDVYTNMYRKVQKNDRLAAGYTMQQYDRACRQAFLTAAKEADPTWQLGRPIPSGALDKVTRESIESHPVRTVRIHAVCSVRTLPWSVFWMFWFF